MASNAACERFVSLLPGLGARCPHHSYLAGGGSGGGSRPKLPNRSSLHDGFSSKPVHSPDGKSTYCTINEIRRPRNGLDQGGGASGAVLGEAQETQNGEQQAVADNNKRGVGPRTGTAVVKRQRQAGDDQGQQMSQQGVNRDVAAGGVVAAQGVPMRSSVSFKSPVEQDAAVVGGGGQQEGAAGGGGGWGGDQVMHQESSNVAAHQGREASLSLVSEEGGAGRSGEDGQDMEQGASGDRGTARLPTQEEFDRAFIDSKSHPETCKQGDSFNIPDCSILCRALVSSPVAGQAKVVQKNTSKKHLVLSVTLHDVVDQTTFNVTAGFHQLVENGVDCSSQDARSKLVQDGWSKQSFHLACQQQSERHSGGGDVSKFQPRESPYKLACRLILAGTAKLIVGQPLGAIIDLNALKTLGNDRETALYAPRHYIFFGRIDSATPNCLPPSGFLINPRINPSRSLHLR